MFKIKKLILSPAMPAAILLYGIIFGFALWSYLGLKWLRIDTITLYVSIAVWSGAVIFGSKRPQARASGQPSARYFAISLFRYFAI